MVNSLRLIARKSRLIETSKEYAEKVTETIGGFTGVHLGIFAHTQTKTISYADFDWTDFRFETKKIEE